MCVLTRWLANTTCTRWPALPGGDPAVPTAAFGGAAAAAARAAAAELAMRHTQNSMRDGAIAVVWGFMLNNAQADQPLIQSLQNNAMCHVCSLERVNEKCYFVNIYIYWRKKMAFCAPIECVGAFLNHKHWTRFRVSVNACESPLP